MSAINLGGPMPDGSLAADLWVDQRNFVCASGAMLSEGPFKNFLGKLCLTRSGLIMLPYGGSVLALAGMLAEHLKKTLLGPYADLAETLGKLGLYAKGPEVLDKVAFWPLAKLDGPAAARERTFLFIRGGADLLVKAGGATYCFNMASRGHEAAGFASAQDFRDHINRLRR